MKIFLLTLSVLGLLAAPAWAYHTADHAQALHTIKIDVNGLVCDFCARAIEKVFYQQQGVEGVDVNLDNHLVKLDVSDTATLTDAEITKLITDAGYNVVKINRE